MLFLTNPFMLPCVIDLQKEHQEQHASPREKLCIHVTRIVLPTNVVQHHISTSHKLLNPQNTTGELPTPDRCHTCLPLHESMYKCAGNFSRSSRKHKMFLRRKLSERMPALAYSSASAELRAIVRCVLAEVHLGLLSPRTKHSCDHPSFAPSSQGRRGALKRHSAPSMTLSSAMRAFLNSAPLSDRTSEGIVPTAKHTPDEGPPHF